MTLKRGRRTRKRRAWTTDYNAEALCLLRDAGAATMTARASYAISVLGRRGRHGVASAVAGIFAISIFAVSAASAQKAVPFAERLVAAAVAQTGSSVTYDGSYRRIAYPGGDVPASVGVCTDVVIRAYRVVGIDLQVEVHEDMLRAFRAHPQLWGMARPDANIDHRRVPNLQAFFRRHGADQRVVRDGAAYLPGDLVTWVLPGNLPHIGIVTGQKSSAGTPMIVHNMGRGPEVEDMLFKYRVTGHYRYDGESSAGHRTGR